ncbi:unnamed protein product [Tilletia controversa]|uniref:Synaptobrevin homolog YKT6 n=3 Tax=Tilletia TaxID=13289 RepID=A0A8X7MW90_9BASI|nr:hypothetical protein CF336_g8596 [Tilletia laevis]KAE8182815.1 hypothetical protein CF328_g8390 [Tilletia controversa]KAE8241731.1 hypothetical protein A4X03_0g8097 [Tilletia caries]KAE8183889.1 hypothetical protein CF335_g8188 [Tilletia laevis]KAE8249894.1 hypothetical protein A4X06_0g3025 [Tilletia controversa]
MIVLALVSAGTQVLVESHVAEEHARFLTAAETILGRIPDGNSKMTFSFESWLFHYIAENGLVYLALAESESGRRIPFTFLLELQRHFLESFPSPPPTAPESFLPTLQTLMGNFNDPAKDAVSNARTELAETKNIMSQNIEAIMSRGERIDLLMDRTDHLHTESLAFRKRAVGLRRQMWWKNAKVVALAGFCVVLLLVILFGAFR